MIIIGLLIIGILVYIHYFYEIKTPPDKAIIASNPTEDTSEEEDPITIEDPIPIEDPLITKNNILKRNGDVKYNNIQSQDLSSNLKDIKEYCDAADYVIEKHATRMLYPKTSTYKRLCSGGLDDAVEFIDNIPLYASINIGTFDSTAIPDFENWCEAGKALIPDHTNLVDPSLNPSYNTYCDSCFSDVVHYTPLEYNLQTINPMSLDMEDVRSMVQDYCTAADNILDLPNSCSLVDPLKSSVYKKCTTASGTRLSPATAASLASTSSKFLKLEYDLTGTKDTDITNSLDMIQNYCDTGQILIDSDYTQIANPNDPNRIYGRFCNPNLALAGKFADKKYDMSNIYMSAGSLNSNKELIKNWCQDGQALKDAGYTNVTNPDDATNYDKLCSPCFDDSIHFMDLNLGINGIHFGNITSNETMLKDYCVTGSNIINSNCRSVLIDPYDSNISKYAQLCCDDDGNNCGPNTIDQLKIAELAAASEPSLEIIPLTSIGANLTNIANYCTNVATSITNKVRRYYQPSYTYAQYCQSPNQPVLDKIVSWTQNKDSYGNLSSAGLANAIPAIKTWCDLGNDLIGSGETLVDPTKNQSYQNYCNPCFERSVNFMNQDYALGVFNVSSAASNKAALQSYCSLGVDIINNQCFKMVDPRKSATFNRICCPDGADKCDPMASKVINQSTFNNLDYTFGNYNLAMISGGINNLNNYCAAGRALNNPNTTNYNKFCCDSGICSVDKFNQCTVTAGTFGNLDPRFDNVNMNNLIYNAGGASQYCQAGYSTLNNCSTNLYNPNNYGNFNRLCCSGSKGCTSDALNSNVALSDYYTNYANLHKNLVTYPDYVKIANKDTIKQTCDKAKSIMTTYGIDLTGEYFYSNLCKSPYYA